MITRFNYLTMILFPLIKFLKIHCHYTKWIFRMVRSSKQQITSHGRFLFYKSIFTTKLSFSNIFHTNYANVGRLLKPFTFNYNHCKQLFQCIYELVHWCRFPIRKLKKKSRSRFLKYTSRSGHLSKGKLKKIDN